MQRRIDSHLVRWKNDPRRRVLLVRGARQVGKTYSVRRLGRSFESIVEVDFEEHPEVSGLFSRDLSPGGIIEKLTAFYGKPIRPSISSRGKFHRGSVAIPLLPFLSNSILKSGP